MDMKYKIAILLFLKCVISGCVVAQVKPLAKAKGAYVSRSDKPGLIIPHWDLRVDEKNKLFVRDSLIFEPKDEFSICFYEFTGKHYIIVTARDSSKIHSAIQYGLPKRKIKVFKIGTIIQSWDLDLKGMMLINVIKDQVVVKNAQGQKSMFNLNTK